MGENKLLTKEKPILDRQNQALLNQLATEIEQNSEVAHLEFSLSPAVLELIHTVNFL
jgi:hypothetical protein